MGVTIRTNNTKHYLQAHYATADQDLCCLMRKSTYKRVYGKFLLSPL
jgi:hypothetical protein